MIVKNILLTGASSGIGEALALYYAKQPETENIFICGRNQQRLQAVKAVSYTHLDVYKRQPQPR